MSQITLEGVRVHNLRGISVKIPHNAVTVICGVSGSGKSSLAFDTLFAEGQRRYVETFSPQARLYLDQLERPDVDRLEGIPPAVAIRQQRRLSSPLSTVGSRTDLLRYLQLLFAQVGRQHCPACGEHVRSWTPDAVAGDLVDRHAEARGMIAFPVPDDMTVNDCIAQGFARGILGDCSVRLEELDADDSSGLLVVVDRIRIEEDAAQRIAEAARQAFDQSGACQVFVEQQDGSRVVDERCWQVEVYSVARECSQGHPPLPPLTQELLSFHSVIGACPTCHGTGVSDSADQTVCPECLGTRLNPFARAVQLADHNLPEVLELECGETTQWLNSVRVDLSAAEQRALSTVLQQLDRRLQVLKDMGLSYLSLSRTLMTLSGGEARRVQLTSVLGSGLINTLYVLDEPASAMHPSEVARVVSLIRRLQQAGNTVVVVEHDLSIIAQADHVVELGPDAGVAGGEIVFEGAPEALRQADTHTARALNGTIATDTGKELSANAADRADRRWLRITGIRSNNIQDASLDLPLQSLVAVTGVSGSGKSSLVVDAVYPELQRTLAADSAPSESRCDIADGVQYVNDVQLLEQNPLQRSSRSIPATYLGAFDHIRKLLAETHEAAKRSFTPGTFSFNSARGGRCERCQGHGLITIDMQFLADVEATCENCQGRRFRSDVLEIRYRDRAVDEILKMTADEAFTFFNGHPRIQKPLASLTRIGLGYLTLGQPLSTLSGGEAQRLRIAALLAGLRTPQDSVAHERKSGAPTEAGAVYLLDEPSSGLHAHDRERLMNCLKQLVQVGQSVVIIEHDQSLVEQCDYRVVMGPGSGRDGGRIVSAEWL